MKLTLPLVSLVFVVLLSSVARRLPAFPCSLVMILCERGSSKNPVFIYADDRRNVGCSRAGMTPGVGWDRHASRRSFSGSSCLTGPRLADHGSTGGSVEAPKAMNA